MPKTEEEINAEKAAKSRPDLIPAPAAEILLFASESGNIYHAYRCLLEFRADLDVKALVKSMSIVVDVLGGFATAMLAVGTVMGYGFRKHGKCTWRVAGTEQADPQTHLASAERHLLEHLANYDATEEGSGYPVLYHALAQLCILYDLIVDEPQIPGVNDGHGMIGDRPDPAKQEAVTLPPAPEDDPDNVWEEDDPDNVWEEDDPDNVCVGDLRGDENARYVLTSYDGNRFRALWLSDCTTREITAAEARRDILFQRKYKL